MANNTSVLCPWIPSSVPSTGVSIYTKVSRDTMGRGRCAEVAEDWSERTLEVSGFTLSSPDCEGREVIRLITLIYHIIP